MDYIFTSCALNYIPKAEILAQSVKKWWPDSIVCLCLSDKKPKNICDNTIFDLVYSVEEISEDFDEKWIFQHNIVELSTAIKPAFFKKLLNFPDCSRVFYLDPDVVIFSKPKFRDALDSSKNIILTPHLTDPEPSDRGVLDNELSALRHGTFNLGFLGIRKSEESHRFLDWWSNRLFKFCYADIPSGIFTDQRWIDLAPSMFEGVHILQDRTCNVASWNIATRTMSRKQDGTYCINGKPLQFYHFTGFDSGAHDVMLDVYGEGNSVLLNLVSWYRRETEKRSRSSKYAKVPWAYGKFSDGTVIDDAHRRFYRSRPDLHELFPNPFTVNDGSAANDFLTWWQHHYEDPTSHNIKENSQEIEANQEFLHSTDRRNRLYRFCRRAARFWTNKAYRKYTIQQLRVIFHDWGIVGIWKKILQ